MLYNCYYQGMRDNSRGEATERRQNLVYTHQKIEALEPKNIKKAVKIFIF